MMGNKFFAIRFASKKLKGHLLRNICGFVAILLTAIMFSSLITIITGMNVAVKQSNILKSGSLSHVVIKSISDEEFKDIQKSSKNQNIERIGYRKILAESIVNKELINNPVEFSYKDKNALVNSFEELDGGYLPKKSNEIIMDTNTLKLLQKRAMAGEKITLNLKIREKVVSRDFVLAGWWHPKGHSHIGQVVVSKEYIKEYNEIDLLSKNEQGTEYNTGQVQMGVYFKSDDNVEEKIGEIIKKAGFSTDEKSMNYVKVNINPAYKNAEGAYDLKAWMMMGILCAIIVLTGFLIIYNVFQLSVVNETKFFGIIKAIGASDGFVTKLIRRQIFLLTVISTPIGLIIGFYLGKNIFPYVMNHMAVGNMEVTIAPDYRIFIVAGLFTIVTAYISGYMPARIARRISPIEAVNYTEYSYNKKEKKKSNNANKLYKFAYYNVCRNKKGLFSTLGSLSLSMVLFICTINIGSSFDLDKYVKDFIDVDYQITSKGLLKNDYKTGKDSVPLEVVKRLDKTSQVALGNIIYSKGVEEGSFFVKDKKYVIEGNVGPDGYPETNLYGTDKKLIRDNTIESSPNVKEIKEDQQIFSGVHVDGEGGILKKNNINVGDEIVLQRGTNSSIEYKIKKYTVAGLIKINNNTMTCRAAYMGNFELYLPEEEYKRFVGSEEIMTYNFNAKKGGAGIVEGELQSLTKEYPNLAYVSRETYKKEFDGLRQTFNLIMWTLTIIIGIIALMNFINTFATNVLNRRREIGTLRSIGMTEVQLLKLLLFESLYFMGIAYAVAVFIAKVLQMTLIKAICNQMSFLSYSSSTVSYILLLPGVIIIAIIIPVFLKILLSKDKLLIDK